MKTLLKAIAVGCVTTAPVFAYAQPGQQPVTRAQVRAELLQAEQAGYSPLDWSDYPYGEVQAAEFRAAVQKLPMADSGYGSNSGATSQSGDIAR